MTHDLDDLELLRRHMGSAPTPTTADLGRTKEVLLAVIEREVAGEPPVRITATRVGDRHRRPRLALPVLSIAAAVVLVAVVVALAIPGGTPVPRSSHLPIRDLSWRLVNSTTSPFRSLPQGGQPDLQCVSDAVCYSPAASSTLTLGARAPLYRTTDGGQNWQATAPIPLNLQVGQIAFSCSDADTCAAIGSPATPSAGELAEFAITTDQGAHWHTSVIPAPPGIPNPSPGQFVCGDAAHCIVSVNGYPTVPAGTSEIPADRVGTFLRTSDGGRTWVAATSAPSAAAASVWTMNCAPDGSCLAVSLMGENPSSWIVGLRSTDWGATWTAGTSTVPTEAPIVYASCGDATHCMLVPLAGPSGAPYEIVTTADAGRTWQVTGPPAGWLNMPTVVSCAPDTSCWIAMSDYDATSALGDYSDPVIEVSHDDGTTWSAVPLPSNKPPISDVITLSCPPSGDGCMGIGNLEDHFVLPPRAPNGTPPVLSGPLVISNLPAASS